MTTATPSLKQIAFGDLEHELRTTRRVLERVPEEHLGWKPHERSMSLGELASHLVNLLFWQSSVVTRDELDLAADTPSPAPMRTTEELLARFDEEASRLRAELGRLGDDALFRSWTLKKGDRVVLSQPRLAVMRGMGISHIVHHRGQLSVYLRLLEVPVPPIYGPSADESMG